MAIFVRHVGRSPWLMIALFLTVSAVAAQEGVTLLRRGTEAPFLAENDAAMTRMMSGMTIKPSGKVDADFAAMMIPHHQGAIEMAEAELRYGHNEQLRRIAQEIIVEQQQEIAAMRVALGQPIPPSVAAPTQIQAVPLPFGETSGQGATNMAHSPMLMNAERNP